MPISSSFSLDQDQQDAVKLNDPAVFGNSGSMDAPQTAAEAAGEGHALKKPVKSVCMLLIYVCVLHALT